MSKKEPEIQRARQSLEKALIVQPHMIVPDYPIKLTPQSPYVMNRAALVFVLPDILSPADNLAEYGWLAFSESEVGVEHIPGREGARVIAWFRPSEENRKYNVDFSCEGETGQSFVLALSTGDTETVHVSGDFSAVLISELVGTTFEANNKNWRSFSLSMTGHWKLLSFEVNQLPA